MFRKMMPLSLLMLLLSVHCAVPGTPPEGSPAKPRPPRLGLALPTLAEERWARDLGLMVSRAKEMGFDLLVQVTMNDQNQQNFNIEQLITLGVDVLIINPHDSFGVGRVVEQAKSAGIKVISYDRLIMNENIDLFVSYDNHEVGRMQGAFLAEKAKSGNYIVLSGPKYDSNARYYHAGAMEELRPLIDRGDIQVVFDRDVKNWSPDATRELVESVLVTYRGDIAAILAPNDGMASGAISALKQHGLRGKVVVTGQDADALAVKRIMDGSQSMTVFKDIAKEVEATLNAAMRLAKGESVAPLTNGKTVDNGKYRVPAILLEPVVIDGSNLGALVEAGHLKAEVLE